MSTASVATSSDTLLAYREYLQNKVSKFKASGFEVDDLSPYLFDFQRHCVETALLKGRYALFQDCGLGKTLQQLEWSRKVVDHTKQPLTPFMGIGSEVFQAVKMNRKGIGFELKDSYFDVAVKNVQAAIDGKKQMTIFEVIDQ